MTITTNEAVGYIAEVLFASDSPLQARVKADQLLVDLVRSGNVRLWADRGEVVGCSEHHNHGPHEDLSIVDWDGQGGQELFASHLLMEFRSNHDFMSGALTTDPIFFREIDEWPYAWRGRWPLAVVRLWGLRVDRTELNAALAFCEASDRNMQVPQVEPVAPLTIRRPRGPLPEAMVELFGQYDAAFKPVFREGDLLKPELIKDLEADLELIRERERRRRNGEVANPLSKIEIETLIIEKNKDLHAEGKPSIGIGAAQTYIRELATTAGRSLPRQGLRRVIEEIVRPLNAGADGKQKRGRRPLR